MREIDEKKIYEDEKPVNQRRKDERKTKKNHYVLVV